MKTTTTTKAKSTRIDADLDGSKLPRFVVADLETDPFKEWEDPSEQIVPKPFAAGVYDGKTYWIYWGVGCVKRMLKKCVELGCIIYMHNGGNFDFHYIYSLLAVEKTEFLEVGGKRIVQMTPPGKCPPIFRDSYALVPRRLKEWAKDDIDYNKMLPENREANKREIIDYLKVDLSSLYTLMTAAQRRNQADYLTLASASFAKLKASLPEKWISVGEGFDAEYRPFYFAGRVQCKRFGKIPGEWEVYDINSAFPHAMLSLHWWGSKCTVTDERPKAHLEQCFVDVSCHSCGAFPLRQKAKVEFPTGFARYMVTGWEFVTAERLNLISAATVHAYHIPDELMSYEDFVLPRYAEKLAAEKSGNSESRIFSKLELNSAYGKTGQDPSQFSEICCRKWGTWPTKEIKLNNGKMQIVQDNSWELSRDDEAAGLSFFKRPAYGPHNTKPKRYNNVAIAASITGFVRARIMEAIHLCGAVYCDTDSVFIPKGRGTPLSVGSGLGDWKHEFTFTDLWIGGRKLYAGIGNSPGKFGSTWKTAAKGVKLTPDKIVDVCEGKTVTSRFAAPSFSLRTGTRFIARRVKMPSDWKTWGIRDDAEEIPDTPPESACSGENPA